MEMNSMAFYLPLLFMLHDFEEIIFIRGWKNKRQNMEKKGPFEDFQSTESFSLAVAEEFLIFSAITLWSVFRGQYRLWYGAFFAVIFHLMGHVIISIKQRRYTPGVVTSILLFPAGLFLLYRSAHLLPYSLGTLVLSCLLSSLLLIANLWGLHAAMLRFEKWVK